MGLGCEGSPGKARDQPVCVPGPRPSEVLWFYKFSESGYHCPEGGMLVPGLCDFQAPQLGIGDRKTANIPFQNLLLDNFKLYL